MQEPDMKIYESFDLPSLNTELERREKAIADLEESIKWAIKEHEDEIVRLRAAIKWKEEKEQGKVNEH